MQTYLPFRTAGVVETQDRGAFATPLLTLRSLVGSIGLFVAITATILIPAGYFLITYQIIARNLTFVASLELDAGGEIYP